jgi:hypothetical protein
MASAYEQPSDRPPEWVSLLAVSITAAIVMAGLVALLLPQLDLNATLAWP